MTARLTLAVLLLALALACAERARQQQEAVSLPPDHPIFKHSIVTVPMEIAGELP